MPDRKPVPRQRRKLGTALREMRDRAGYTQHDVAAELGWTQVMKVSRIENGTRATRLADLTTLLELYDANPETIETLQRYWREDTGRSRMSWWKAYDSLLTAAYAELLENEDAAVAAWEFVPNAFPGPLQHPDYARHLIAYGPNAYGDDQITDLCDVRARRRDLLTREDPLEYVAVLGEGALRALVGGPEVMRRQLDTVLAVTRRRRDNVTIRIVPYLAGAPATQSGAVTLYRFDTEPDASIAFLEIVGDTVVRDSPHELRKYRRFFHDLEQVALSPAESLAMIEDAAKELG